MTTPLKSEKITGTTLPQSYDTGTNFRPGDAKSLESSRVNFNSKTMTMGFAFQTVQNPSSTARSQFSGKKILDKSYLLANKAANLTNHKFAIKVHLKRNEKEANKTAEYIDQTENYNRSKSAVPKSRAKLRSQLDSQFGHKTTKTLTNQTLPEGSRYINLETMIMDERSANTAKPSSSIKNKTKNPEPRGNLLRKSTIKQDQVEPQAKSNLRKKINFLMQESLSIAEQSSSNDNQNHVDSPAKKDRQMSTKQNALEKDIDALQPSEGSRGEHSIKIDKVSRSSQHASKIEDTSFYENYPIDLPSRLFKDPHLDMYLKPLQFLEQYDTALETFIYQFFQREDGMMNCLETGQPYHTESQKKLQQELKKMEREDAIEKAKIIFDARIPMEISDNPGSKEEKVYPMKKYIDMANEMFEKAYAEMKVIDKAAEAVREMFEFKPELRKGIPRYRANLFPNEVEEIEQIYKKMSKGTKATEDEIELISNLIKELNFFKKIDDEQRINLIKGATFRKYNPGDFVVKQGDQGTSMFIILYGAANVMINGIHPKTKLPHLFRVASLPDGSSFGEYSLLSFPSPPQGGSTIWQAINELKSTLNPKGIKKVLEVTKRERELVEGNDKVTIEVVGRTRMRQIVEDRKTSNYKEVVASMKPPFVPNTRAASIQVYETSYMLEVSAALFKEAIVEKIKQEMLEKIRLLSLQTFFAAHTGINFVPMAMLMKRVEYKFGEAIIRCEETPSSMLLIKSGCVEVVSVLQRSREENTDIYSHVSRKPLRNLIFQNKTNHAINLFEKEDREEQERINLEKIKQERAMNAPSTRIFSFDQVVGTEKEQGRKKYYDFFISRRLFQGDCLFTRSLFSKDIAGDGTLVEGMDPEIEKSRLSVIAASAKVVCYELKKNLIVFIPEPTKSILLREIKRIIDHDIDVTHIAVSNMEQWDDYKEHVYINQLILRQLAKREDAYKKY